MNDYLTFLAARRLNLVEVIQPRITPIFEPPGMADRSVSEHSPGLEIKDGDQTAGKPTVDLSPAVQPLSLRREGTDRIEDGDQTAAKPTVDLSPAVQPLSFRQKGRDRVEVLYHHPRGSTTQPASAKMLEPISQSKAGRPSANRATERIWPALEPASQGDRTEGMVLTEESPPQGVPFPKPSTTKKVESLIPVTATVVAQPQVQVKTAEYVMPPSVSREPISTIRVTIGRIDVRAIMGSEASSRKKTLPSTPRLSLEDYLKQRNGGRA
jgi:hypothetical protein